MSGKTVWRLPVLAQEFESGPRTTLTGDELTIEYDFETGIGGRAWSRIVFFGVRGVQFTAAPWCTVEMVDAYGKLVEMADSPWADTLFESAESVGPNKRPRHYRIFLDDVGCFDVAARDFAADPLPAPPMTSPAQ